MLNDSFGQYLKALRKSREMSMDAVFKKTGITDSRLSKLEHDQILDPTISAICKLSRCYGVDVLDMLSEAGMDVDKSTPLQHTSFLTKKEINALQQVIDLLTKERWK